MASQHGHPESPLIDRLRTEPYRFEFYQAVKLLELLAGRFRHAVRSLAEGPTPHHEALRIKAHSSFAFPPSSLVTLELPPALRELPGILQELPRELTALLRSTGTTDLNPAASTPAAGSLANALSFQPLHQLLRLLEAGVRPDHHTRGDVWHEWKVAVGQSRGAVDALPAAPDLIQAAGVTTGGSGELHGTERLRAMLQRLDQLLDSFTVPVLTIGFLSLGGALGPLPHAYSELVLARGARGDPAASDFLDIFHHRLASLMFRVRKHFTIGLSTEPPTHDPLARRLSAFLGLPGRHGLGAAGCSRARLLPYAGLVAWQPHAASAIERCLSDHFALPVSVLPATGGWLHLEPGQRTRIGRAGANQELGGSAVLGTRVWDQQGTFDLRLGPLTRPQFEDFLPTGTAYAPLCALTRFLVGPELDFRIELELAQHEPSALRLGPAAKPRLGWNTWLGASAGPAQNAIPRCVRLAEGRPLRAEPGGALSPPSPTPPGDGREQRSNYGH
ncbi:MAG: type VI secretion system baseplate subunit TssG [Verrucomicrobiales bacterium]|nr:type VI secretion system baseplate subunit TssG [Verrucomicrobiales bacterium]